METWLKSFRKDYFFYACRNINSVLKNSEEYKHNKGIVHNAIHIPFGDKLINGVEVNHIVSLGSHCLAASILKKLGIKKYSLPFDWNFTHPGMVIDCLNDNFKVFLDKKYHKSIQVIRESGIIDQCASHTYYEKKYKTVEAFNHRDVTVSRNYEYLCRTIGRFQRLLKSKDSKIFLLIFRHHIDLDLYFDELYDALASKTKNFSLICISLDEFKSDDIYKIKKYVKKIHHFLYAINKIR